MAYPHLVLLLALLFVEGCKKSDSGDDTSPPDMATATFRESTEDFPNPERGFYTYSETSANDYTPLSASELRSLRSASQASGGHYTIVSTLVFRYFVLDAFKNAPLSGSYLALVSKDFFIAREAGVKLIVRFTYTTTASPGNCPEGFICPPYGDAPKSVVLQHIAQLKPLLQENADVIAVVQAGFIGVWGEQYYTDHFGDASQNGQGKVLDQNWTDRTDVMKGLLDAVPKERMVQVRYPQLKQRTVYGINAPVSAVALTEQEAYSGSDKARIGYHNDCFLASADDFGTYEDYGSSSTPRQSALDVLKAYKKADSKFVAVGGETCSDGFSPQNDCAPAGRAEAEMRDLHYSYLNSAYNNEVNDDWQDGGCMDNIKRNLGYRFVLTKAEASSRLKAGDSLHLRIELKNTGFAAPFNARPLKLVMTGEAGEPLLLDLTDDVRRWFSGDLLVSASVVVPPSAKPGRYRLHLFLPDPYPRLAARSEYAIRFANDEVWDETTGYNNLHITTEIE